MLRRVAQVVLDLGARFWFRVNHATTDPAPNPLNASKFAITR